MPILNALASVAVKNLAAAVVWYEKVFGRPPDSRPMPEVAEWGFERGGGLQVYQLPERAGSGSFTLVGRAPRGEISSGIARGSQRTSHLGLTTDTAMLLSKSPDIGHYRNLAPLNSK